MFASPLVVLHDLVLFLRHPWSRAETSPLTHRERLADAMLLAVVALAVMLALGFAIERLILAAGHSLWFDPPTWGRLTPGLQLLHLAVEVPLVEAFIFVLWLRRPPLGLGFEAAIPHAVLWTAWGGTCLLAGYLTNIGTDGVTAYAAATAVVLYAAAPFGETEKETLYDVNAASDQRPLAIFYAWLVHGLGLLFMLLGIGAMSGAPWYWLVLARLPWLVAFWVYAWLRVRFGFAYAVAAYGAHNAALWALG